MREKIKKNKFNIIVLTIYGLISLGLVLFHEQWRDEAQQWLIVKNLDLFGIIKQMKYEGHFLLWYLILFPFVKLGFPVITENIISWLFVLIAVWLILKKAPFSNFSKALIIFTFPMIYLYPVISRSYCLIPLSVVLVSLFYKDRREKPLRYVLSLVLLANTHIIMLGMVGLLVIEFIFENIKNRKSFSKNEKYRIILSLVLCAFLLILSGLPLLNSLNLNKSIKDINKDVFYNVVSVIIIEPVKTIIVIFCFLFETNFALILITIFCGYIVFYEISNYPRDLIRILLILLWQFCINYFIYDTTMQRASSVLFIYLFFLWNRRIKCKDSFDKCYKLSIVVLVIINIISGIPYYISEIMFNYSSAKQVAEYMNQNLSEDSVILVGNQPEFCTSMMLFTDLKFYSIQRGEYFTYIVYDGLNQEQLEDNFMEDVEEKFENCDNLYYMYSKIKQSKDSDTKIIRGLEKDGTMKKIYESDNSLLSQENFILYKVEF